MQKTFYEIKVRCLNEKEAEDVLKPLNLGAPKISHVTGTYLKSDSPNTEKIYEVDDEVFYTVVESTPSGFLMTKKGITQAEKEDHLKKREIDKIMRKERRIWMVGELEVATDTVEGLEGIFIEVSGPREESLKSFFLKLGINESRFLTKPYNKFLQ